VSRWLFTHVRRSSLSLVPLMLGAALLTSCTAASESGVSVSGQLWGLGDPTARFSAAAAGNFSYGDRADADIEYIVVHTMQGYYGGSISWFQNPSSNVSAHYLVRSTDGEITQMVDVSDVAYHDACFNSQSIGIEHEGFIAESDVWYTDAMYESSARLSAWLAETYGIPLDREHILGHGETDDCSDHTDPGPDWDWDKYMTLIREAAEPILGAELVDFGVPASAKPGTMVEVWFELENQSSDVFDAVRTRLVTAEPDARESELFVEGAWLSKTEVMAPLDSIEPGKSGRFTFQIHVPDAPDGTVVSEGFQLRHEGKTFGPLLYVDLEVKRSAPSDMSDLGEPGVSAGKPRPGDEPEQDAGADTDPALDSTPNVDPAPSVQSSATCSAHPASPSQGGVFALALLALLLCARSRALSALPFLLLLTLGCERSSREPATSPAICSECDGGGAPQTGNDAQVTPDGQATTGGGEDGTDEGGTEAPNPNLVELSHRREMRGVWIASVGNINFPSAQGLSAEQQKAELDAIVETTLAHGLNAIFFQVRPEADALYASELEPWSRFLTGTQGQDPGFDPLAYIVEKSHAKGIELHAWLNPYRAASNAAVSTAKNHVSKTLAAHVHKYGSLLWMDPGEKAVQEHTRAVVRDIAERYAVDGIHFDDYFYPYPDGTAFPDSASYGAAKASDPDLTLGDFRRAAVHALVRGVAEDLRAIKPGLVFGISPFGIYRPGMPAGITGLDQYAEIYSDPMRWIDEGWVDYLAPQLYWPTTQKAQAYEALLDFWAERAAGHCLMLAGNNLSNLGKTGWDLAEMRAQIELGREPTRTTHGNIFFTISPITNNTLGLADMLKDELYATAVLTPVPVRLRDLERPEPPALMLRGHTARFMASSEARAFVLYRQLESDWSIVRIYPASEDALLLEAGVWGLTQVAPSGIESLGVRFEVVE